MPEKIPLFEEMIQIANKDSLPKDHLLRVRAIELEAALNGELEAKKVVGAWARARKAYCEYTGTPLVDPVAVETGAKLIAFLSGKAI